MAKHARLVSILLVALATFTSTPGRLSARPAARSPQPDRGATRTLLSDGTWLVVGGEQRPSQALISDPATDTTRVAGLLTVPRTDHTATVLSDGTVLVAGGRDPANGLVKTAERYDASTAAFSEVPDSPFSARAEHTATLLTDGRVLFTGGSRAPGAPAAEVWDPARHTVLPVTQGAADRLGAAARLLPDGWVEIAGGVDVRGRPLGGSVFFDPDRSVFETRHPATFRGAPTITFSSPADGAVDVPVDGTLVIRLSHPGDPASLRSSLTLDGLDDVPVPVDVVVAEAGMLAFIRPTVPLSIDRVYRLALAGARLQTGRPLDRWSIRFHTTTPEPTAANPDVDLFSRAASERALASRWRQLPSLQAGAGETALAGQVLQLDGNPLPGVTLGLDGQRAQSDASGRFLIRLRTTASCWKVLTIEGTTVHRGSDRYGRFEVAAQLVGGKTATLPYTIWMPRLDMAHAVRIPSPTREETVITTPAIPSLELHLPPNTVVTDEDGRVVRELSITPIPVDRSPFPLPSGVGVPVYFTIQPGGAYVHTSGPGRKGAWLVYPNYRHDAPGTVGTFWHYDPDHLGWYVYSTGLVTPDARQVVPRPDAALYEFTGAMMNTGLTPGDAGGNGPPDADPVDLGTGQLVMEKTDLTLADVIPLTLTRTYRTGDAGNRPFGVGAMHPYAMFLWSANQYQEADLILPNGKRIHYVRTSSGTGFTDAVFAHTASPTKFYKSTIAWNGSGWDLALKDGTVYVFGENAPLQAIRDRFGNTVTLTWSQTGGTGSGFGNILKVTSPNNRWIGFTYDTSNRITQATDNIGRAVSYQYDAAGNLWKVTDARGGVTEYTYDLAHRMLTVKDPRNTVYLTNEYDTSGRVERQTQADSGVYDIAYTTSGGVVTQVDVTNPRGYVRRVNFNSDRFMTSDVRALEESIEQSTTYSRASGSNFVDSITDPLGRVTHFAYDSLGNVTNVTRLYGTTDAVTTSLTYESAYSRLASVTDPLNHTTTVAYDSQSRIQSATDALNHQTTYQTNVSGQVTSMTDSLSKVTDFTYDFGDLVQLRSPAGRSSTRFVDAAGRVTRVTGPTGSVSKLEWDAHNHLTKVVDPRGGETTFTYDGDGNLLTLTDARNKTTTWTYDSSDRVSTRTDPLNRQESFAYDLRGNLTAWTDRKGQVTVYQYDALDRQFFVGYGATGNPPTYQSTITSTFDGASRLTQLVDTSGGTISRTYDSLDRVLTETTAAGTVTYTYDNADRRSSMTVSGQLTTSYTYDDADRLTGVSRGSKSVGITYDNADRRASLTLANGVVMEYAYDDDSQLTSVTYKQGASTLGTLTYTYDESGRRTGVAGTYARTALPAALSSATYDDTNQVATWSGTQFTYDANGNLTNDGVRSFTWNPRNELTALSGTVSASFGYDGFGRRHSKTVGSVTTDFLYDGANPVQEQSAGTVVANLLTGLGIDEYLLREDGTGDLNYLADAMGSSIALTDASGTVQTEYTYDAFGSTTASGATTSSAFAFTGREADGTGLYYNRARYYDPGTARFVSEDPIQAAGGLNLYAYAQDSPVLFSDPFGLKPLTFDQVKDLVGPNNHSGQSDELIICIIYKESTFDPDAKRDDPSQTARGLMGIVKGTAGDIDVDYDSLGDPAKNIDAGTRILQRKINWKGYGHGNVRVGLRKYGPSYRYADKLLECEKCLKDNADKTSECKVDKCLKPLHGGK